MDISSELAALKKEVAQLKQQLADYARFFTVCQHDENSDDKVLTIRCSVIMLADPDHPGNSQGIIAGGGDGPIVALWGSDGKARAIMQVADDKGSVQIFQEGLKLASEMSETEKGEPYVAVFNDGHPRAQIKGTPDNGVLSAIHNDGHVRAVMISNPTHGELLVVGGDMKPAVKLSSEGQDGGGFLTVNHPNGKAAAIVSSTPLGGCVILNDSRGKIIDGLPNLRPGPDQGGGE